MLTNKQMMREDLHKKLNLLPEEQLPEVVQFLEYLDKKKASEPTAVHQRHFGCGKGIFLDVADDFDAPLELTSSQQSFSQDLF